MEETERMVALKKAYAEIILNMAKEAATRVMAAERKAKKFEHDLLFTKDEALRLLFRLKQMMEVKNTEAEVASLNQQRKIEELELQLDEAEGLILDLREKLGKVQEQLDDAKSKPTHSLRPNEKIAMSNCHVSFSELDFKPVTSEVRTSSWDPSVFSNQCLRPVEEIAVPNSEFDNGLVDNPVFTPMVLENTEPQLYRNGCTQRICAIEKGLMDEKRPLVDDPYSLVKSISIIRKNEHHGGNPIKPSRTDKLNLIENVVKEAPLLKDNSTNDWFMKVHKLRRRRARYGKAKASRCRYFSGQCVKPQRTSSAIARCKSHSLFNKDVGKSGDTSSKIQNMKEAENGCQLEEKVQLGKHEIVSVVRRTLRKRKVKHWGDFATSCRLQETCLCRDKEPSQSIKAVQFGQNSGEYLPKVRVEGELEEGNGKAAFTIVSNCMKCDGDSSFLEVAEKDTKSIDEPMLVNYNRLAPEMEMENILLVPSEERGSKMSELTTEAPSQHESTMSELTTEAPNQHKNKMSELTTKVFNEHESNKPFKYTFSRKRKKGSLITHDEDHAFGEISRKRGSAEPKDVLVPQKTSAVDGSSCESRGLVQVARQLISLSGKRWW